MMAEQAQANKQTEPKESNSKSANKQQANEIPVVKMFFAALVLSVLVVGVYFLLAKNIHHSSKGLLSLEKSDPVKASNFETLVVPDNRHTAFWGYNYVLEILSSYGHKLSYSEEITQLKDTDLQKYNLIWTDSYPFQIITKLNISQRINHFPGSEYITDITKLSQTLQVSNVLKAFKLPDERDRFLYYAKQNPNKMWTQKSIGRREISIETTETVNLTPSGGTIVQEYIANPLLIDGKKFDIAVYAALTSVEPLRVYIYEPQSLLRFCKEPYIDNATEQFNPSNINSFTVIHNELTPIELISSFRPYHRANLSMKRSLINYLRSLDKDGEQIWRQIEETIKIVYKMNEHLLARMTRMFHKTNNYGRIYDESFLNQFFELVQFHFTVDENLKVYLVEANTSPDYSWHLFPITRVVYERVLSSLFSLVGLTQYAGQHPTGLPVLVLNGHYRPIPEAINNDCDHRFCINHVIDEQELSIEGSCSKDVCRYLSNCTITDCMQCYFCIGDDDRLHLKRAIYEHHFKWNFKRLLPSTRDEDLDMQLIHPDTHLKTVDSNYFHVQWFRRKCYLDKRFCTY